MALVDHRLPLEAVFIAASPHEQHPVPGNTDSPTGNPGLHMAATVDLTLSQSGCFSGVFTC